MNRTARRLLLACTGLALAALGVGMVELVFFRGRTPPIEGPEAVSSLQSIELGGVEQWVLLRGRDAGNPVVLFLHGGPGMPSMYLAHAFQEPLERDFLMVQWDRRGAGKSFSAAGDGQALTVSQTLADTLELTRLLRRRFAQDRIYLLGHSWGSHLGLLAVREHPEYYRAFIGTGQLAGSRAEAASLRRRFVTRAARAAGESELADRLARGEEPVSEGLVFRFGGELHGSDSFWPLLKTGLLAPEYTLKDVLNVKQGAALVARSMRYDMDPEPLQGEVAHVQVPVYFLLGRHDYNTPSSLAAEYLRRLDAPLKGFAWFEESAHFPFFEEPERFRAEMLRLHDEVSAFHSRAASP